MSIELKGFIVPIIVCWEDNTWTDEVQVYLEKEDAVDQVADIFLQYYVSVSEDKKAFRSIGGCAEISHTFVSVAELATNYDPDDVMLRCSFYLAHGVILEMIEESYSAAPDKIFSLLKLSAEFQSIFGVPFLPYQKNGFKTPSF